MTLHWTNHQERTLCNLVSQGFTDETMAERFGRSVMSVRHKRYALGVLRTRRRMMPSTPPPETVTITKAELVAYYAIGWRVDWFEGETVGLKWVNSPLREPYCPANQCMRGSV